MLYLINHIIWFDDNSIRRAIRREIYFCLIEEKSLYIIRASTNTNLKKRLGNTTKRKIKAIIWNHIRGRGIIDDGLTCIEIGWDDGCRYGYLLAGAKFLTALRTKRPFVGGGAVASYQCLGDIAVSVAVIDIVV